MLTSLFGYYNCYIESTDDSSSDPARYVPIWVSYDTCAVWINNGSQSTNILAGIENAENISFSLGYCN